MKPNNRIRYRDGYKYQLASDYCIELKIRPKKDIDAGRILLDEDGNLTIREGYAWDGPSGPVVDTKGTMRGSLIHDALYQLMRHEYLESKLYKKRADIIFKHICIEDGISRLRAHMFYIGLKIFGRPFSEPKSKKEVKIAP